MFTSLRARRRRAAFVMGAILLAGCVPLTWTTDDVGKAWIGRPLDQLKQQWKAPIEAELADGGYEVTIDWTRKGYTSSRFREDRHPDGVGGWVIEGRSEEYEVPDVHQCTATFIANSRRIITSYQFTGRDCREKATSWGPPID